MVVGGPPSIDYLFTFAKGCKLHESNSDNDNDTSTKFTRTIHAGIEWQATRIAITAIRLYYTQHTTRLPSKLYLFVEDSFAGMDGLSTYRGIIYPNKLSTDLFTLKFTHYIRSRLLPLLIIRRPTTGRHNIRPINKILITQPVSITHCTG